MMFYRQGDVLLRKVGTIPATAQEEAGNIVARGEVTGHAHRLIGEAVLFRDPASQQLWARVMGPTTLTHDEHGTITVALGLYEIVGQREYTAGDLRRVTD